MTEQEYLLTCLAEECSEVVQAVTKALRFGLDDKYAERPVNSESLANEVVDVLALVEMLVDRDLLPFGSGEFDFQAALNAKIAKVKHYMEYSRERGILA